MEYSKELEKLDKEIERIEYEISETWNLKQNIYSRIPEEVLAGKNSRYSPDWLTKDDLELILNHTQERIPWVKESLDKLEEKTEKFAQIIRWTMEIIPKVDSDVAEKIGKIYIGVEDLMLSHNYESLEELNRLREEREKIINR